MPSVAILTLLDDVRKLCRSEIGTKEGEECYLKEVIEKYEGMSIGY